MRYRGALAPDWPRPSGRRCGPAPPWRVGGPRRAQWRWYPSVRRSWRPVLLSLNLRLNAALRTPALARARRLSAPRWCAVRAARAGVRGELRSAPFHERLGDLPQEPLAVAASHT